MTTQELEHQLRPTATLLLNPTDNPFGLTATDRVGIFTKHPDDAEMMLAFAIMEATAKLPGNVHAMVAVNGEESTRGDREFVKNLGRVGETIAGLGSLGVERSHIFMPGLPDGVHTSPDVARADDKDYQALVVSTLEFIATRGITVAITLGRDGGDGTQQHIDSHDAVVDVARISGRPIRVFGLNARKNGEVFIHGGEERLHRKMGSVAANRSQFPMELSLHNDELMTASRISIGGFTIPPETARHMGPYMLYLDFESYDNIAL